MRHIGIIRLEVLRLNRNQFLPPKGKPFLLKRRHQKVTVSGQTVAARVGRGSAPAL